MRPVGGCRARRWASRPGGRRTCATLPGRGSRR
nr:MAG TPA: hypothetical protein [Caudoviricetes sp.]